MCPALISPPDDRAGPLWRGRRPARNTPLPPVWSTSKYANAREPSEQGVSVNTREPLVVAENGRGDPADAVGVGDGVDLDDPAVGDGEAEDGEGPAAHGDDHAGGPVDQGRTELGGGEGAGQGLPGHGGRAAGHPGGGGSSGAEVGAEHDVGVEQADQGVEVAAAGRPEEG